MAFYSPSKIMVLFAHFHAAASQSWVGDPWNFKVVSGSCAVKTDEWGRQCVYSDGAVVGPRKAYSTQSQYSNNQDCVIKQNVHFPFNVHSFDVEGPVPYDWWPSALTHCWYDYLEVDGVRYCGKNGPGGGSEFTGSNIWIKEGSELIWHTDYSVTRAGFKICVLDPGGRPWF